MSKIMESHIMCRSPRDFSKHQEKLTNVFQETLWWREELSKKKKLEEAEKQRLRDGKKEREKEAKKLEQSRRNLYVREEELEKSEELKESELQKKKHFMKKAIKNKNFNEVTVAQGLLEVAKKKMDDVMEQSRQCSSKRSQLTKNKKRLLEGYSKHVSSKKKKSHWMLRTRCSAHLL